MDTKPYFYTLPNGVRIVTFQVAQEPQYNIRIDTNVGNAHLAPAHAGLAHLVEHLAFAGTTSRTEDQINDVRKETLGWLGAYTTELNTTYTGGGVWKDGPDNFEKTADVMADMIQNSIIPQSRLDHEKNVVVNEIRQRMDNPTMRLYERMNAAIHCGYATGRSIGGTEEAVLGFTREECLSVFDLYDPSRIVISASGPGTAEEMAAVFIEKFSDMKLKTSPPFIMPSRMHSGFHDIDTNDFLMQNHFRAVVPVSIGSQSADFWLVEILNQVVGERLSDRRGKIDVTYGINCNTTMEPHASYMNINGCTHPKTSDQFLGEMSEAIRSFREEGLTLDEIERAKQQQIVYFSTINNYGNKMTFVLADEMSLRGGVFDSQARIDLLASKSPQAIQEMLAGALTDAISLGYMGRDANFMDFDRFQALCGQAKPQISAKNHFASPRVDICS